MNTVNMIFIMKQDIDKHIIETISYVIIPLSDMGFEIIILILWVIQFKCAHI